MFLIPLGTNSSTLTFPHHSQHQNHFCANAILGVKQNTWWKLSPQTRYHHKGSRWEPVLDTSWRTGEGHRNDMPNKINSVTSCHFHLCFVFPFLFDEVHLNDQIFHMAFHRALHTFHSKWLLEIMQCLEKEVYVLSGITRPNGRITLC